ncbi:MAG TPA: four helix bundle protein [Thermoanaerobaculaceae bacterium]|nr:four helix bundle protein [Thermoanaerobaculaceae bacterium]
MRRFTELKVWERSHQLVLKVCQLTAGFPRSEVFGLTSQLRRASVSVPANIAEGAKRRSQRDFAHFINVAEGSLSEVEYLLALSRDLGYVSAADVEQTLGETTQVLRMLASLRRAVERSK